jgi:hypothetical protein
MQIWEILNFSKESRFLFEKRDTQFCSQIRDLSKIGAGRGAGGLARQLGVLEVVGSNPIAPISFSHHCIGVGVNFRGCSKNSQN